MLNNFNFTRIGAHERYYVCEMQRMALAHAATYLPLACLTHNMPTRSCACLVMCAERANFMESNVSDICFHFGKECHSQNFPSSHTRISTLHHGRAHPPAGDPRGSPYGGFRNISTLERNVAHKSFHPHTPATLHHGRAHPPAGEVALTVAMESFVSDMVSLTKLSILTHLHTPRVTQEVAATVALGWKVL